jgi:hypothetical protein
MTKVLSKCSCHRRKTSLENENGNDKNIKKIDFVIAAAPNFGHYSVSVGYWVRYIP